LVTTGFALTSAVTKRYRIRLHDQLIQLFKGMWHDGIKHAAHKSIETLRILSDAAHC